MAGVTNVAFRTLCRELELARAGTVSGLYVCEMVTARALVERHPVTMHMTTFGADESPRSLQLYAVDPDNTYAAAKMIVSASSEPKVGITELSMFLFIMRPGPPREKTRPVALLLAVSAAATKIMLSF